MPASAVVVWAALVTAQPTGPLGFFEPWPHASGPYANADAAPREVHRLAIERAGAPWLRVHFASTALGPGDRLLVVSLEDGHHASMDARTLQEWEDTTPYFNGGRLLLLLVAAPGSSGPGWRIAGLEVGNPPPAAATQCGATDDRLPSVEPRVCRTLTSPSATAGCSAAMVGHATILTAGHCVNPSFRPVAEFNCPPSVGGSIRHPAPEDQYLGNQATLVFVNGGTGNDYGVYELNRHATTGVLAGDVQGFYRVRAGAPANGSTLRITGYGQDTPDPTRNYAQQTHTGPLTAVASRLQYQVDTQGGNSGSGVIEEATQQYVGAHTHGGCQTTGTGANSGTSVALNAAFLNAVNASLQRTNDPAGVVRVLAAGPRGAAAGRFEVTHAGPAGTIATVVIDLENAQTPARFDAVTNPTGPPGGSFTVQGLGTPRLRLAIAGLDPGETLAFDAVVTRLAGGAALVEDLAGGHAAAGPAAGRGHVEGARFIGSGASASPDAGDTDQLRATATVAPGGVISFLHAGRAGDLAYLFLSRIGAFPASPPLLLLGNVFAADGLVSWSLTVPPEVPAPLDLEFTAVRAEVAPTVLVLTSPAPVRIR
jgi:V8-like Glu-specific endopeptidase